MENTMKGHPIKLGLALSIDRRTRVATICRAYGSGLVALTSLYLCAGRAQSQLTVEQLLTDGWKIAGYTASSAPTVSFILFKHKDRNSLVQCSVLYDVTRSQKAGERVVSNCYEIR
jgi:hypothetical protein